MLAARRSTALAVGALVALLVGLPAVGGTPGRARTEARLRAVQAAIVHAGSRVRLDRVARVRLTRELRKAELAERQARAALARVEHELATVQATRNKLALERHKRATEIAANRAILIAELRAAYLIGRSGSLKLLLNQSHPARAGRMLAYYGFLGRARARLLARLSAESTQLSKLDARLADEQDHLTTLQGQERAAVAQMASARQRRRAALASLDVQARMQVARERRLEREQTGLERLLQRLRRVPEHRRAAGDFARLRGTLAWPVAGRIAERFGTSRGGGLKWEGDLIATALGAPVRAVCAGRVVFANRLPGLGLLIIIDNGGGYLSLYGHDKRLYKRVGDEVAAGDLIATAGETGGAARPELYFGIREGVRPIDPGPWFKKRSPKP